MSKYIDADELRARMYHEAFETDSDMQRWDSGCWIRYKMFENALKQMPAADVAEVKHSHWVKDDDSIIHGHCYHCGWAAIWQETDIFGSNYCPNCGASMDNKEATE